MPRPPLSPRLLAAIGERPTCFQEGGSAGWVRIDRRVFAFELADGRDTGVLLGSWSIEEFARLHRSIAAQLGEVTAPAVPVPDLLERYWDSGAPHQTLSVEYVPVGDDQLVDAELTLFGHRRQPKGMLADTPHLLLIGVFDPGEAEPLVLDLMGRYEDFDELDDEVLDLPHVEDPAVYRYDYCDNRLLLVSPSLSEVLGWFGVRTEDV